MIQYKFKPLATPSKPLQTSPNLSHSPTGVRRRPRFQFHLLSPPHTNATNTTTTINTINTNTNNTNTNDTNNNNANNNANNAHLGLPAGRPAALRRC